MSEKLQTIGDIARALNTTGPTVTKLMTGTAPTETIMNGRVKLYTLEQVRTVVEAKHADVLAFLGYLPRSESYDVITTA